MSPPAPKPALERALVRACSEAARQTSCEIARGETAATPAATVTWVSEETVNVEVRPSDGSAPIIRRLAFRPSDQPIDRWQAVGLVVASAMGAGPVSSVPPERAAPPVPARASAVWLGVGGLVGRGLHDGSPSYGGWLRAGYRILHSPVFVSLGTSYAVSAVLDGVSPEWATLSLGAGALFESEMLHLTIRPALELSLDHLAVRSEETTRFPSSSGGRWVPATQASVTVVWPAHAPVAVVVGGLAGFATGATGVRVRGAETASFPAISYTGLVGIEFGFLR